MGERSNEVWWGQWHFQVGQKRMRRVRSPQNHTDSRDEPHPPQVRKSALVSIIQVVGGPPKLDQNSSTEPRVDLHGQRISQDKLPLIDYDQENLTAWLYFSVSGRDSASLKTRPTPNRVPTVE